MTITQTSAAPTLADLIDPTELQAEIDGGWVRRKTHPELPLSIYVYSEQCQFAHHWTPVTMRCRGLIVDDSTDQIVALPFPKIFVTAMHGVHDFAPPLPNEPFEIFEKADGSLAICYYYDGRWHAASKGSFISEQAQWAQAALDRSDLSALDPSLTYLAEAIYPANRIVVDYGTREDLVLLAAFRTDGTEAALSEIGHQWAPIGSVVRSWGLHDSRAPIEELAEAGAALDGRSVRGTEEEGYVIRFASGVRAKIKLSTYLALHKLYTGTNERTVWEVLASGQDPAVLFDHVPDELAQRGGVFHLNGTEADEITDAVMAIVEPILADYHRLKLYEDADQAAARRVRDEWEDGRVTRRNELRAAMHGNLEPGPTPVPAAERRSHRCDERCTCPEDGQPMWYAPSTGQHACQDPDCAYAHPVETSTGE